MKQIDKMIFKTRVRDPNMKDENPFVWKDLSTEEVFEGKTVVVFALPGAFTPTCSSTHLPGYEAAYDQIKSLGVDEVYCLSVNDAFTLYQWGKQLNIAKTQFLPDGNGQFSRYMGMLVKKENLGFGDRSWRYSMVVVNGEIEKVFEEPGKSDNHQSDPFEVSDAQTMLDYLKTR